MKKEVQASSVRSTCAGAIVWGMLIVGIGLALSGCRTYGRYDSQEKMLPQMQQAVRLFDEHLQRARAQQGLLKQAAATDSSLHAVAQEFRRAVNHHEQVLSENRRILDRYEDDLGSYRDMHRAYGAMISEHQAVRNRYRSLIRAVRYPGIIQRVQADGGRTGSAARRALPDTLSRTRAENFTEGRYYVAPVFYEQLQSVGSDEVTMRQALAERRQRQSQEGRLSLGRRTETRLPSADSPN